jgi:hypothetical protein
MRAFHGKDVTSSRKLEVSMGRFEQYLKVAWGLSR